MLAGVVSKIKINGSMSSDREISRQDGKKVDVNYFPEISSQKRVTCKIPLHVTPFDAELFSCPSLHSIYGYCLNGGEDRDKSRSWYI